MNLWDVDGSFPRHLNVTRSSNVYALFSLSVSRTGVVVAIIVDVDDDDDRKLDGDLSGCTHVRAR